jgi:aminoglycoside phosphotransferase (APT) family kinase protein
VTTDALTQGAEPAVVGPYLARVLADPAWRDCSVALISGGKSNLTYVVTSAAGEVVLRRPPLSTVLATAHDMGREHTVLAALDGTAVPVPRVRHLCRDTSVLGVPFYLMDRVDGYVIRRTMPEGYCEDAAQRRALSEALVDVLVEINRVDLARLEGFGPPTGYLERQMRRWARQWAASKEADLPALDRLSEELTARLPEQRETTLVHGDYRLDNTIVRRDAPEVAAVLDWELSTLGDPLADLGLLMVYWAGRSEDPATEVVPSVTGLPGFLSRREVVERYAQRSGRDVSALPWYAGFGYFKLAVVSAGIAARHRAGAMLGEGFDTYSTVVPGLVDSGRAVLAAGEIR